jgi:hypothetical protein
VQLLYKAEQGRTEKRQFPRSQPATDHLHGIGRLELPRIIELQHINPEIALKLPYRIPHWNILPRQHRKSSASIHHSISFPAIFLKTAIVHTLHFHFIRNTPYYTSKKARQLSVGLSPSPAPTPSFATNNRTDFGFRPASAVRLPALHDTARGTETPSVAHEVVRVHFVQFNCEGNL